MAQKIVLHIPTRDYIDTLEVGNKALDRLGNFTEIREIFYRETRENKEHYIALDLAINSRRGIAQCLFEEKLTRTRALDAHFTSYQVDGIEQRMKHQGVNFIELTADEILEKFISLKVAE